MEWEIRVREWEFSFWCGALTIGVGRHVLVREIIIGVGRLFVVWEIAIGVGILFLMWETPLGVGRLLLVWGIFRGLPAHFYRRIEPGSASDLTHAPTAGPFLRNSWCGASFSTSDSLGTD